MPSSAEARECLAQLDGVRIEYDAPLNRYARFGVGGPADVLLDAASEEAFARALEAVRGLGVPWTVIGGGTNLIVADEGYRGAVLRYTADSIIAEATRVRAEAGAILQDLVDFTIEHGLAGIQTMTGIPGWVGGAVYGNAGAYGRSINQSIAAVRFFDGQRVRSFTNQECGFSYRESAFKARKDWIVFSADLTLARGEAAELRAKANDILDIRNAKYPPTMKCAGSIFKNLILAELEPHVREVVPERAIIEGKVPSAWFLEQVEAKGMRRGDIHVAGYHANLIYNGGEGTSQQVREIIDELKARVIERFGLELEEEVQYVGFAAR